MGKYLQNYFHFRTACSRTFGSKKGYGFWRESGSNLFGITKGGWEKGTASRGRYGLGVKTLPRMANDEPKSVNKMQIDGRINL
jgi:hypothetical protein